MNQELRKNKAIVRDFMKAQYTDDRLAQLLDHARSGKLEYGSCCCFIGIATADHPLRMETDQMGGHYSTAKSLPMAEQAEDAFCHVGDGANANVRNSSRRSILIPIVKAEIRRRMRLQFAAEVEAVERVGVAQ